MDKFVEVLEDLILEKNITLTQIAKDSNISVVTYARYLKGAYYPNIESAVKIAQYFNCSLDYLFGLSDERNYKVRKESVDCSLFLTRYNALLKANKTSHWKFSKENNLSEANIRHWKSGTRPNMTTLIEIASDFCSSIDYLLGKV